MCGIVGYIGHNDTKEILLKGLEKLEYRGYDSAGIAVVNEDGTHIFKEKGRIATLREHVDTNIQTNIGIGHTRWATHGVPNKTNSHPHQSMNGRFTLVHNGVIENYYSLKTNCIQNDITLKSETDSEIIVQMIQLAVDHGMSTEEAFRTTLKELEGSYAIAMIDNENADTLYVAKNKSPLLVGFNDNSHVVTSDAMAMLQITNTYVEIMDKEIVIIKQKEHNIKNLNGETMTRKPFVTKIDAHDIEKGTYPHFMIKEIDEQPLVMRNIITNYQKDGKLKIEQEVREGIQNADRLYIVACGTSYHAGLVGKDFLEKWAKIPTEVHIASEFNYNMPLISENPLFVFISQSGETADSRAVLKTVKEKGWKALTLTNVEGSTLSREADDTLLLHAGPEIAVASTKAYTAQISVLAILAYDAAKNKGIELDFDLIKELAIVGNAMEVLCDKKEAFENIAKDYLSQTRNAFFIGRGLDYHVCLEAALKLKEISYIQAEGFAGGELKHGTIALIEDGTPVIALATQENVNLSIRGNVQEVAARGANTCIISMESLESEGDQFVLPKVHHALTSLISVIPMQIISYYAALHRDCDVDKPRNLAKSVTVE